jgi:hypothetical protein
MKSGQLPVRVGLVRLYSRSRYDIVRIRLYDRAFGHFVVYSM